MTTNALFQAALLLASVATNAITDMLHSSTGTLNLHILADVCRTRSASDYF